MNIYVNLFLYSGIHFLQFSNGWSCNAIKIFKVFQIEKLP